MDHLTQLDIIMKSSCINCQKEIDKRDKYFPFCSDKCSKIDLFRWLDNKYVISKDIDFDN